jgi:hypothetical protein
MLIFRSLVAINAFLPDLILKACSYLANVTLTMPRIRPLEIEQEESAAA